MQLLQGQSVTAFRDSTLTVGPVSLPLMTQDYIGALNTYATLPFIIMFGSTPMALRTMSIIVGAITLLISYVLGYKLTQQPWVGLLAATLLSVDPTFIFWNRQGIFVTAVTAAIGLAATYCWFKRLQGRTFYWSIAGTFLFGLGIYAKFLFVWLIAALLGTVILLNLGRLIREWHVLISTVKNLSPSELIAVPLAFLLGCTPLIIYNIQTGGTFLNISQNASTSYYGVDNLAFGPNLAERLSQFITLLSGSHFWYLGNVFSNYWAAIMFAAILGGTIAFSTRKSSTESDQPPFSTKTTLFPFIVIGLVIGVSIGTVSALWVTHFAILMPWPALAIAIGTWFILFHLNKHLYRVILLAGLVILVITNLVTTIRYHLALTESGGLSSHSDAVYDLTDWLSQHAQGEVVAMDWGLAAPIIYLTNGQVAATELFGYGWQSDQQLQQRLSTAINHPNTLYLWPSPDEIIFDRSTDFKALYRPQNLEENIEEAFYEKSGRPILGVTRLMEKGTAPNPPQ